MKKFRYIEIARGISAILVVLHHATLDAPAFYNAMPFDNFFYFGMAGVDFFFVLSGFIIYYVHSDDQGTLLGVRDYIIKRFIRVYPIFLFVSVLLLSAYLLLPQWSPKSNMIDLGFLITSFLLLPSPEPPLLSVSWTLVHEMFFYFIFILIILNKKFGGIVFVVWAMMILSYNLFIKDSIFPYSFYLSKFNSEFLFGIVTAFLIKSNISEHLQKYSKYIALIGLIGFLSNGINVDYKLIELNGFVTTIIYGASASVIIMGLTMLPPSKSESSIFRILLLLGAASYSIYLIHNPLQSVLHRIINKFDIVLFVDPKIIFLTIVFICIVAGIIMHLFIEKPVLNYLRNKFLSKQNSAKDDLCVE